MKRSKQAYYDKYFETNWNNIKNTWKGIISVISLKFVASHVPTALSLDNGDTITNPYVVLLIPSIITLFLKLKLRKKHKIFT